MATETAPDIQLPSDQQAMQDSLAESANQARSATDVADDVAMGAITAREGINLGAKIINFGSKLLKGKQLIGGAMLRSRIPYVGTALLADYATKAYRREIQGIDDGKGLFALAGEDLGTRFANRAYADEIERNSQPITQEELKAIYEGKNPLKPIVEMTPTGTSGLFGVPSMQRVVTGYEPMRDVSSPVPAPEPTMVDSQPLTDAERADLMSQISPSIPDIPKRGVGAPEIAPNVAPDIIPEVAPEVAPEVSPRIEIAPQIGQLNDEEIMRARQLRESQLAPEAVEPAPIISSTPQEGLSEFTDKQGNTFYGDKKAIQTFGNNVPKAPTDVKSSITSVAPIVKVDSEAPEAPEATEMPPEAPAVDPETSTPPKSPEESPAPAGTPEEQKTPEQSEYDKEIIEQEEGLREYASRVGYTEEQTEKMLEGVRERRAEAEEKEQLEKLLQILQMEKMMIGNALLKQELNKPHVEEPDPRDIIAMDRYLTEKGVKRDPNTNGFTLVEEGFFYDKEKPLNPMSALFQELYGTAVGRYMMNLAPPDLLQAKNRKQLTTDEFYEVDDGRIFGFDGKDLRVVVDFSQFEELQNLVDQSEEEEE